MTILRYMAGLSLLIISIGAISRLWAPYSMGDPEPSWGRFFFLLIAGVAGLIFGLTTLGLMP